MRNRIDSLDLLRGLVIVIMALDHVRDFFSVAPFAPTDLDQTSVAFFLTRWVTHFCAPVFVLLAGIGAFLYGNKVNDKANLSRFLLSRGLWLILIEITVISFAWDFAINGIFLQVIWAIGWSMVILAGLVWLPRTAIAAVGLVIILGHNLLDGITPQDWGSLGWFWSFLHVENYSSFGGEGLMVFIVYPILPWVGVMAVGYAMGPVFLESRKKRKKVLVRWGIAVTLFFILLRMINLYGDPSPWAPQERGPMFTVFDFLRLTKYPPSLLFLAMTLGPTLTLLPFLEEVNGRWSNWLKTFGRVPFFFYILHLFVIHLANICWNYLLYGIPYAFWFGNLDQWPATYEPNLWVTYIAWILLTVGLYFPCRWFDGVKKRRREWWIRFL